MASTVVAAADDRTALDAPPCRRCSVYTQAKSIDVQVTSGPMMTTRKLAWSKKPATHAVAKLGSIIWRVFCGLGDQGASRDSVTAESLDSGDAKLRTHGSPPL